MLALTVAASTEERIISFDDEPDQRSQTFWAVVDKKMHIVFDILEVDLSVPESKRYLRLLRKNRADSQYEFYIPSLDSMKCFSKFETPTELWRNLEEQWRLTIEGFKRRTYGIVEHLGPYAYVEYRGISVLRKASRESLQDVLELREIRSQERDSDTSSRNLSIDVDAFEIIYYGERYKLASRAAALWLKVLIVDRPNKWTTSSELRKYESDLEGVRPDKLKKYIPSEILELIESEKSKGSRIVISES